MAIFFVVEGLIIWTVIRYRRKPGMTRSTPDPRQQHRRVRVDDRPEIIVIFMFVVSWQTLNTVDVTSASARRRSGPLPAQFQWTFDYLDPATGRILYTSSSRWPEGGGMAVPSAGPSS